MSKKKKNGKPTNRELKRARERDQAVIAALDLPKRDLLTNTFLPDETGPKFRVGDLVTLTDGIYGRFGLDLTVLDVGKLPISGGWGYRLAAGSTVLYPEKDIKLVEGAPARAAGLDLGEL